MGNKINRKITKEIRDKFVSVYYYINDLYEKGLIDNPTKLRMQRFSFSLYDTKEEDIIGMLDKWTNKKNKSR